MRDEPDRNFERRERGQGADESWLGIANMGREDPDSDALLGEFQVDQMARGENREVALRQVEPLPVQPVDHDFGTVEADEISAGQVVRRLKRAESRKI